jgi:pilus assembly protein CpaF
MALGRFSLRKSLQQPVPMAPVAPQLSGKPKAGQGDVLVADGESQTQKRRLLTAKLRIHRRLIDEINLAAMDKMPEKEVRAQIHELVAQHVATERIVLNAQELVQFVDDILHEMIGLGPIEPLLKDETINDILINTHRQIYIERAGRLELSDARFKNEAHLLRIINKIVSTVGRRVDETQPMCDARLLDGSRVNVAIKPIAVDGPLVSIRKFSKRPLAMERLIEINSICHEMAAVLVAAVAGRITILVSGGTGSGKTTMLNALSSFISHEERLITIEDAAELQLQQPHVGRMETRPPNIEGKGEIRQRELVKNALRMRPDRIIVGECRGEEAFDMLQAMNTGHEGSLTTVHANTPRDALARLENMIAMANLSLAPRAARQQIASAITVVIQTIRLTDGRRKVSSIQEITGMEGDIIAMQEIYAFTQTGVGDDGAVQGYFHATGVRPKFAERLRSFGVVLPDAMFDPAKRYH